MPFQLMGQDFHVAADLLVGYSGIYLGGFQIRMPQKMCIRDSFTNIRTGNFPLFGNGSERLFTKSK